MPEFLRESVSPLEGSPKILGETSPPKFSGRKVRGRRFPRAGRRQKFERDAFLEQGDASATGEAFHQPGRRFTVRDGATRSQAGGRRPGELQLGVVPGAVEEVGDLPGQSGGGLFLLGGAVEEA
jgi:hypothetical protein